MSIDVDFRFPWAVEHRSTSSILRLSISVSILLFNALFFSDFGPLGGVITEFV